MNKSSRSALCLQYVLDQFHYARKRIVAFIAYLAFRLYASEVTYKQMYDGSFKNRHHADFDLPPGDNLDTLMDLAKADLESAVNRRSHVADKCKVILTLSALLLTFVGVFFPKSLAFESRWLLGFSIVAVLFLMTAVLLILEFFAVSTEHCVGLDSNKVRLSAGALKKHLINRYALCASELENRVDYLVELYKVTRFCFLTAFTLVLLVFTWLAVSQAPADQNEAILRSLRSDRHLTSLLTGPRGPVGERGPVGPAGKPGASGPTGARGEKGDTGKVDEQAIIDRVLNDKRLKQMLSDAIKATAQEIRE